jgi:tRNA nucleotidyltransferase (CCA-adding enzyme)
LVPALRDVSESVLDAIDCLPVPGTKARPHRRSLRIAALLSDLVPPDADRTLRALRFSNHDIAFISTLVSRWHAERTTLTGALCRAEVMDDRSIRRLASSVGRLRAGTFVRLAAARWAAETGTGDDATIAPAPTRVRDLHRRLLRSAFRDPIQVADLAIDGDDLRHVGIRPGPLTGVMLGRLLEDVLDDPARNSREWLLARVASTLPAQD